jgi:chemotaxis protein methyltransferase CheR
MTSSGEDFSREAYDTIVGLVYSRSRICVGAGKQVLLANRLRQRLRELGVRSFDAYCALLKTGHESAEVDVLVDLVTTNHTQFFREPDHFRFLTDRWLVAAAPELERTGTPLKIWSAACSSGEEPYTLAIVLAEFLRAYPRLAWQITASDISARMVDRARAGIYPMGALAQVPEALLKVYFEEGIGSYAGSCRVVETLRNRVQVEKINLFQSSYPVDLGYQIIFCRNALIYFDEPSRLEAVQRLTRHLARGGLLVIGYSESLTGLNHGLVTLQQGIYQRP